MAVFIACWLCSLVSMVLIDYHIGSRARIVNAWSVVLRIRGQTPSVGNSLVYNRVGLSGELLAVFLVTLVSGATIAWVLLHLW